MSFYTNVNKLSSINLISTKFLKVGALLSCFSVYVSWWVHVVCHCQHCFRFYSRNTLQHQDTEAKAGINLYRKIYLRESFFFFEVSIFILQIFCNQKYFCCFLNCFCFFLSLTCWSDNENPKPSVQNWTL